MTAVQASTRYAYENGIARLVLARPGRLNAVTPSMFGAMMGHLDQAERDRARVLVVEGEGAAFCSGADLKLAPHEPPPADDIGRALEEAYNPFFERLFALSIPIIASVQGAAAGAGCSLALAADFVVADRSAYFLLAFANIGLVPDAGLTGLLPRLIGMTRALEMMMLGERIPAEMAEAWGLIYRAVHDPDRAAVVLALAQRLASGPTAAYGLGRAAVRQSATLSFGEALALER